MGEYILVVDDDSDVRTLVLDALTIMGYDGLVAEDGREALAMVANQPPMAIVLDLMMPQMNGFSTITRLQQNNTSKAIPLIIMSGVADNLDSVRRLPGVVGVLRKGEFTFKRFSRLLETAGLGTTSDNGQGTARMQ